MKGKFKLHNLVASFLTVLSGLALAAVLISPLQVIRQAQAAPLAQSGTRSVLTVTTLSRHNNGVAETLYEADGNGQKFFNDGDTFLQLVNNYTSTVTYTIDIPGTVDGVDVGGKVFTVSAGGTRFTANFPPSDYNQSGSDRNYVYVDYPSFVTGTVAASVTIGAYRLP